ncbi:MAG: FAD-binding protein [Verrucomicrobia bacterium]|nr:FAD-binding protein [Verrucomicrobiota bacterium]
MKRHFDFLILGSGFAGSLLAMALRRQGRSVLLIDKSRHPRFAIGESTTPMTNLLLEQFARKWDLPQVLPLTRWGTWHKALPLTAGGLK